MGQHKHNPVAIVAKSGGLPPKKHTFKLYKAIWRAICYGIVVWGKQGGGADNA
jgi:hypothetical protein